MSAEKTRAFVPAVVVRAAHARLDTLETRLELPGAEEAIERGASAVTLHARLAGLLAQLPSTDHWFLSAVVTGSLPHALFVDEITRAVDLGDFDRAADRIIAEITAVVGTRPAPVRVVEDSVLIDVQGLRTGETVGDGRRVATEIVRTAPEGAILVRWREDYSGFVECPMPVGTEQRVEMPESGSTVSGRDSGSPTSSDPETVVVPLGGVYLLPDVCDQPARASRVMALATGSSTVTASIGYGLGPLTDVELFDKWPVEPGGEPRRYSWHLATARVMDTVVSVSTTAFRELSGWKRMLPALGVAGPRVVEGALGRDAVVIEPATDRPRLVLVGADAVTADFETVGHALDVLAARSDEPIEVVRLSAPSEWSDEARDPFVDAERVAADDTVRLRATDVVVSASPYSSHGVTVESLLAAGLRGVVVSNGFGGELEARFGCTTVAPRDELALANALSAALALPVPEPVSSPASWSDFTRLVWTAITRR